MDCIDGMYKRKGRHVLSQTKHVLSIGSDPISGQRRPRSGPEVIKLFSCSNHLSMKFFMLINLRLLTMPNSFLLNIAEHENFSANKYENAN